jgi:23S rRNA (cytidine1920-2'-O)/16S rRNA (cytidine1409-2'-O)-methyltransferase
VLVDGFPVTNPRSLVGRNSVIVIATPQPLRGELKLRAALESFEVGVTGRVAVDVGAAAGGFTKTLLDAGAARVYAVDVGYGQLLGSLRQDERVVNLERTNLAALSVVEPIGVVTIDVSYLSLAAALPQLRLVFEPRADLLALVKPQFELGLSRPPRARATLARALSAAKAGIDAAGWRVISSIESPMRGKRGAVEFFIHARR